MKYNIYESREPWWGLLVVLMAFLAFTFLPVGLVAMAVPRLLAVLAGLVVGFATLYFIPEPWRHVGTMTTPRRYRPGNPVEYWDIH